MPSGCGIHIMTDPSCASCRGGQWYDAVQAAKGPKDPFSAMAGLFPKQSAAEKRASRERQAAMQAAIYGAVLPFAVPFVMVVLVIAVIVAIAGFALRIMEAAVAASMLAWAATLTGILAAAIFGPTMSFTRTDLILNAPRLVKIGLGIGFLVFLPSFLFFASEGVPFVSDSNTPYVPPDMLPNR